MLEGEKRVILSSDLESKPSRKKQEQESKEKQKEKLKTKEYLDKAVLELKNVLESLPKNSKEAKRAEHTLKSVEWALGNLGKEGAPKGKYRLEMKDHEGKPAKWPDGKLAVQNEGVPVDELIELLKGKAKELNTEARKKKNVQDKKKEMDELWERYRSAHNVDLKDQTHDKAWVYSQWEKAKKTFEAAEEAYDLGYDQKGKELDDLADELTKRSETHFNAHYNHELPLSKEESDRQNVRTTHEAYLIHHDFRKTGSNDKDYKAGMDAMGKRRELKMEEDQVKEKDKDEFVPPPMAGPIKIKNPEAAAPKKPEIFKPTVEPIAPEIKPKLPKLELKPIIEVPPPPKPEIRGVIVNAEAQVELLARKRANERLTEMFNKAGRLKKMWFRAWEEGYRQQLIAEERKKILGEGNNPNWLKQKLFGAEKITATGKKDLFAGKAEMQGESKKELGALAERFSKGYIHESEGEQKKQLEDEKFNTQINGLVKEYMVGGMSDEEFEQKKDVIVTAIAKEYPDSFGGGKLTADNFLEAAKEYRKTYEHSNGLARIDVNLGVDLGRAKQAIKTEANVKWVDKMIAKMQKYPVLGHVFTPGAVGFGVSVGGYLFKKPLYWLGGAVGVGGLLGGMRRNFEQKRDLEMHRIEAAMGNKIADYGTDAKRRQEMEKYVHEMKKASEVSTQLEGFRTAFDANPSPENAAALTKLLAETEARMSLSESRQRDLISFEGESSLERGRLYLMKELAEAKVGLNKKGFASNIAVSQEYKDAMASLGGSMDKLETSEKKHRWKENVKAAAVGAVTGLVVGGLAQQAAAEIGDRVSWLSWMRPGGKATGMEKLYHFVKGDVMTLPTGAGLIEAVGIAGAHGTIKVDGTTELVFNRANGLYDLVDKTDHSVLAQVGIDPATGVTRLNPGSYDSNLIELHSRSIGGGSRSMEDFMNSMRGSLPKGANLQEMNHVGFYDNDTVSPKFDFNELRYHMHADTHGNITMDAGKIQEYLENNLGEQVSGSKHGEKALDMLNAFKNGEIKIAIAPNPDHPSQMFTLEIDPVTHKFVLPAGSGLDKFLSVDSTGNVAPKTNVVIGMIENPQGTKDVTWINSLRGNEGDVDTGLGKQIANEIVRKKPTDWWMPVVAVFRRKALEEYKGKKKDGSGKEKQPDTNQPNDGGNEKDQDLDKDSIVDKEGKKIDGIIIFEEGEKEDDARKKLVGKKFKQKVVVDTRGQKIVHDRKDYGKDYPDKFPFKNEKDMARYLADRYKDTGRILAKAGDVETLKKLDDAGRVKFLEEAIKKSRQGMEMKDGKIMPPEKVAELVEFVIGEVNKEFQTHGQAGKSDMPDATKVHMTGVYEFQAQANGTEALGLCYFQSGEIFVNYELLKNITKNNNELIRELKRTIAHELAHGAAAANYWTYESDSGDSEETHILRRTGLINIRRQTQGLIKERGRALNEAVTETLAKNITNRIYQAEGVKAPEYKHEPYQAERNVLQLMQEKFKIPFNVFAEAVVNRKALKNLAELMDGKSKEGNKLERPQFMSLIMSVMDFEHKNSSFDYTKTKQLVNGIEGIQISRGMKLSFPESLLDRKGNIKATLVEKYNLVDVEAEAKKIPIAA